MCSTFGCSPWERVTGEPADGDLASLSFDHMIFTMLDQERGRQERQAVAAQYERRSPMGPPPRYTG